MGTVKSSLQLYSYVVRSVYTPSLFSTTAEHVRFKLSWFSTFDRLFPMSFVISNWLCTSVPSSLNVQVRLYVSQDSIAFNGMMFFFLFKSLMYSHPVGISPEIFPFLPPLPIIQHDTTRKTYPHSTSF